jgi:hypothetical protein
LPKKGDIEWTDIIQGKVSLPINKQEIDPIILSASGKPSRSFAAAVDDWELKVSHALRDEGDMRRVTAQQRLLCKMLELFLPEAVFNGTALLGWNPPHREDPGIVSSPVNVFMKHEVLGPQDIEGSVSPPC